MGVTPAIGSLNEDKSVFFSFRYHGNGVNTGPWAGKKLADLIGASNSKNLVGVVTLNDLFFVCSIFVVA